MANLVLCVWQKVGKSPKCEEKERNSSRGPNRRKKVTWPKFRISITRRRKEGNRKNAKKWRKNGAKKFFGTWLDPLSLSLSFFLWFNQSLLWHLSLLSPSLQPSLLPSLGSQFTLLYSCLAVPTFCVLMLQYSTVYFQCKDLFRISDSMSTLVWVQIHQTFHQQ